MLSAVVVLSSSLASDPLFREYVEGAVAKTAGNISPLYRLDAFDWTVLTLYFALLGVLSAFGVYRVKQVVDFWRCRRAAPRPRAFFREDELPRVTVQLPLFNEVYVVERLLEAVAAIDYPRGRLEIQVLDDSTDETRAVAERAVARQRAAGLDVKYIHRDDREGFKAGALENGLKSAAGELVAIFDADFVPRPNCLRELVHFFNDPLVGCAQMRWSHINGSYNLLTRLQTILLDGHFVVEQTVRNRTGGFFNFNGTAGLWRRRAIELSGGWQHDTLTEDTDLSFRAQLMGWRFVYLLEEDAPSEVPVEINAFKAQQRRWAKGVTEVALKLYPRILRSPLPARVKLEMFFRLTGNASYPLMILTSLLQFPLLLVRYNQGLYNLLLLDLPLLALSTFSVVLFYGTAICYLDGPRARRRLLHLPLVMGLGIGLAFSNARAVLEALFRIKTEFVRTPKYKVEGARDETWKRKKYRRRRGLAPAFELTFALYFILASAYAAHMRMWGTIPFLSLFCFGYGYVGLLSLLQTAKPIAD
jgi:cellulose synthase/poly-beta-1,6-N-acetylglucosamine synthase-like glycosyltransferase